MTVYKIPPLKANEGHRAGEWGDLAAPLWKGRLRFIEKGTQGAAILFEDGTTGIVHHSSLKKVITDIEQANVQKPFIYDWRDL